MMLVDNFVHADLHPGNILVRRGDSDIQLVFLDCGLTTDLPDRDWDHFKQLFTAILKGDGRYAASLMIKYADETDITKEDEEKFTDALDIIFIDVRKSKLTDLHMGEFLSSIFRLTRRYHVKLKGNVATLIVGAAILEGIGKKLNPELNILDNAVPFLLKNPKTASKFSLREIFDILKIYPKSTHSNTIL